MHKPFEKFSLTPEQNARLVSLCEANALGQWLSTYDQDLTYDEHLDILDCDTWGEDDDGEDLLCEWYLLEGHSPEQVAGFIRTSFDDAVSTIIRTLDVMGVKKSKPSAKKLLSVDEMFEDFDNEKH